MVFHSQRAKLLRFRDGAWQEIGYGDARILHSEIAGSVRFTLRQEETIEAFSGSSMMLSAGCFFGWKTVWGVSSVQAS